MSNNYQFDFRQHQLLNGSWAEVPVLVGPQRQPLPETRSLLAGTAIIGTVLLETNTPLDSLVDDVGSMLAGESQTGVLIEDELGAGTVTITPESSEIETREAGTSTVPTKMVFDMLYIWENNKAIGHES